MNFKSTIASFLAILLAFLIFQAQKRWNPKEGRFFNWFVILGGPVSAHPLYGNSSLEEQLAHLSKATKMGEMEVHPSVVKYLMGKDIWAASYGPTSTIVTTLEIPSRDKERTIPTICTRPSNTEQDAVLPLVLYFHHGGLLVGSPKVELKMIRYLAQEANVVVCAPNYRKAPKYPYPAAINDAVDVSQYLIEHGQRKSKHDNPLLESLGVSIDPSKVTTFGTSAGGYLAGLVPRILAFHNSNDRSTTSIALQVSLCPMAKPHGGTQSLLLHGTKGDDLWTQPWNTYAWSVYLPHDDGTLASDWRVSLLADPPQEVIPFLPKAVYLELHQRDVLYDEGRMYGQKLQQQQPHLELELVELDTNHMGGIPPLSNGGPGDGALQKAVHYVRDFFLRNKNE